MPKIMYINATGANPTGTVIPLERRKEIYRIACDYNFLILDDDPYHFMYFTEVSNYLKSFFKIATVKLFFLRQKPLILRRLKNNLGSLNFVKFQITTFLSVLF